jgi:hypothetical protein
MDEWGKVVAWLAGVGGLLTVIRNGQSVIGGIVSAFKWLIGFFTKLPATTDGIPKRTVVLIQETRINALWWHQGTWGDKPMLQVVGDFMVTNIWTKEIKLPAAELRYRQGLVRKRWRGDASVKDVDSVYHGRYAIPPNVMTPMRIHFTVPNASRDERKPLVADVIVIDQFNNEHLLKGLVFKNTSHMIP